MQSAFGNLCETMNDFQLLGWGRLFSDWPVIFFLSHHPPTHMEIPLALVPARFPPVCWSRMFISWFSCHFLGNFVYGRLIHHSAFENRSSSSCPLTESCPEFSAGVWVYGKNPSYSELTRTDPHLWHLANKMQLDQAQHYPCGVPGIWGSTAAALCILHILGPRHLIQWQEA